MPQAEAANGAVTTCDFATLSAVIASVQATGGGTIIIDCAGTINFTSTINITTDVTISGRGAVFDGGSPFFDVAFGDTLTLIDLTLQNGSRSETGGVTDGGAISSDGDLNIYGVTFDNNQLLNDGGRVRGAAIYTTGSSLIVGSTFTGNSGTADAVEGGAIGSFHASDETLTIVSTTFDGNQAIGDESGSSTGSLGGAIYATNPIFVDASTFLNNSATDPTTGEGGAIFLTNSNAGEISNSTFENNNALGGGAIFLNGANLDLRTSTFNGNSATFSGGAVSTLGVATIEFNVWNSTFSGNQAGSSGGAIDSFQNSNTTILGSTFKNNTSPDAGSAIDIAGGSTNLSIGGSDHRFDRRQHGREL